MSEDDQKSSLDISIDVIKDVSINLMKVPSIESFRDLSQENQENEENQEENKPIMPYLYIKKKENDKWISYHKSDPSTKYPFVPPYIYINSDTNLYDKDKKKDAYYHIPELKWGNPFMCHAFFDMITGKQYGNDPKNALKEFAHSIERAPSSVMYSYGFEYFWRDYLDNSSNNSSKICNTILYGTRNHAIVLARDRDFIIVINSGEGVENHPRNDKNRNLYKLVCKFRMMQNPYDEFDTFDERWKLINYQIFHEDEVQPNKENLYSNFLPFLQYGFVSGEQTLLDIGVSEFKRKIIWDETILFPNLINDSPVEYILHERVMLLDGGFLYGTEQISGSCTFHSIFWHYIYILVSNNKDVSDWFSEWNIYNWEFYKNSKTNMFESGTQYTLYRLVDIPKITSKQILQNNFEKAIIHSEQIKFIELANPVNTVDSRFWNTQWRDNLTFPDWVYSTSHEKGNNQDMTQREFYNDILKYWTNTLTFKDEIIDRLNDKECWEWFYFFHKCKLLFGFATSGDNTAPAIIYLRMGQLIKRLFPAEDYVDIAERKHKLYNLFKKRFILGAWKPSDINPNSCFDEFIQNILPLYKYILPEHIENNLNVYHLDFSDFNDYGINELKEFEEDKTSNPKLQWVFNKYRNALVLLINQKNYLFTELDSGKLSKLYFRGLSYHVWRLNDLMYTNKQSNFLLMSVMTQKTQVCNIPKSFILRSNVLNYSSYAYGEKTFVAKSEPRYFNMDRENYDGEDFDADLEKAKKGKLTSTDFFQEKDTVPQQKDASAEEKEWNMIRHRWLGTQNSVTGPSDTAFFVWIMDKLTKYRTNFIIEPESEESESEKIPVPETNRGCTWFVYQCIKEKTLPENWKDFRDHLWIFPPENNEGEFEELSQIIFPCSKYCKNFQIYCHCFMPKIWNDLFRSSHQLPIPFDTTYIKQDENIVLEQDGNILSVTKINDEKISPLLTNVWIEKKNILYPELSYNRNELYYQNDKIVLIEYKDQQNKNSFLLFQWIEKHTDILKLVIIEKNENELYHVRSLHPAHREWYIIIDMIETRSLFYINNKDYQIVWDPSWCSGFLNTVPVLCLERNHQPFLLFLLFKNKFSVKDSSFDSESNISNKVSDTDDNKEKYKKDWSLDTEPSVKMIALDEERLDISPSETDEQVIFLYIFGVLVQNDAITSRLFSRIWRIFLWYVHSPTKPAYYDIITHVLMKQFYGSPMKREMIRVAKALYSFVPCIKHCVKYIPTICKKQTQINTELFDLNMDPFNKLPKKININLVHTINLSEYQPLFDTIGTYLQKIKSITSKKLWKKETRELLLALERYRPLWEETIHRRYPLLWSILVSYDDKSEQSEESIKKLWCSMLCNLLFKRLIEIIEYTSEEDTDKIDPDVKIRLLIRLQVQHWYGNLRKRPLLLCMFEITAQLVMLNSQFTKSQTLFDQIKNRTRPVEHILMGVGKSTVLVPWLTMLVLFETENRAIALIQPVHLMEKCRSIVDRIVMPWMTDKTAIVPVNHKTECGVWWDTAKDMAKDTRWIIIGSDSDWKNLYLSVRLHKQPWFLSGELAVIYDEYDSMFAPNRSELNYSQSPEMHPLCPTELEEKRNWIKWYAETLCTLSKGEQKKLEPFNRSNPVDVRHLQKLTQNSKSLEMLQWNQHFGWSHLTDKQDKQTIVPYIYVGVPSEDSQFTDVDICLLLTCSTYFINGVREYDVNELKKKWIFMKEVENNNLQDDHLYQVALRDKLVDSENNAEGWKNKDLVELYLIQEVLPKNMKMVQSQWNISFVDMITTDVSPHMVGFSGTVQVKDANLLEKIVFRGIDEDTPSYQIMNSALSANSPQLIENDIKKIVKYVKELGSKNRAHYAIIDAGSWFRQKPIEEYVYDILEAEPTLIVIYLDNEDKPWKTWKEKTTHKKPYTKPYPNENYLYLYDQRHTVGTDIALPSKIIGVVTVSKNTTFTEVVQGAFRLRSLTKGHQVQMIVNDPSMAANTTELIKTNDETRKKGWEYALARQSIRTRHRLIKNHDIATYHIQIYHPSIFKNSELWAHAEFKDFKYAPYRESFKEYVKLYMAQDDKFFSMNQTDDSNMSSHQGIDQDKNQDKQQNKDIEKKQSVTNFSKITVFSVYEYVSWSKNEYLTEIYHAPEQFKGIFDTLKISLSPGLLLCLHHRRLSTMDNTKFYITKNPEEEKGDNIHSGIFKKDITKEWISNTSRIAQVSAKGFFLWCTWDEWKLIGCPQLYTLQPEELTPGNERFAAFLLRYLNGQSMSHKSKETIERWIEEQGSSFDTFISLWKCKFNDFQIKPGREKTSIDGCPSLNHREAMGII